MILEIAWCSVGVAGFSRSIWLLREAILDRRAVEPDSDGRKTVADGEVEHAYLGVLIYFLWLCPGTIALAYKLGFTSLEDRLNLVAYFFIAALLTMAIRQERDVHYRKLALDLPLPSRRLRRWLSELRFRWRRN